MMKFADSENKKVQLSESKTKEITSSKMQVFPKYCIECGSPLELGDVFCSECGSKIQQEEVVSIEKEESILNGVKFCRYKAILPPIKNFDGVVKKFDGGSQKIRPNNIDINNLDNNIRKFHKPTIEDVKAYCIERRNKVDPERCYNYYESNGWKVGKNPMKDYKAFFRENG